jgi:hypothetical protein
MEFCYCLCGNHVCQFLNSSLGKFIKSGESFAIHLTCHIKRGFLCHVKKHTPFHIAGKSYKGSNAHY